jgi:RimJ/RimL family protein N-acetyltransferase
MAIIKQISESDAAQFLRLQQQLDVETSFMLTEPGERTSTLDEQREIIRLVLAAENQTILVAERDGALVGFVGLRVGYFRRNRHCGHLVMGILQADTGQGLGKLLLAEIERWASAQGLRRLELSVMVDNHRAVRLYRGAGFTLEGTKRESLVVDGRAVDEHVMAKLLPEGLSAGSLGR